jgi:hypothetical protein
MVNLAVIDICFVSLSIGRGETEISLLPRRGPQGQ